MATILLTRYIFASVWARLLIFITFYFVIRELHYCETNLSIAECMPTFDPKEVETRVLNECHRLSPVTQLWQIQDQELYQIAVDSKISEEVARYSRSLNPSSTTNLNASYMQENMGQKTYSQITNYIRNTAELKQQHESLLQRNSILEERVQLLESSLHNYSKTLEQITLRGYSVINTTILECLPERTENESLKARVSILEGEISEQKSLIERLSVERRAAPANHDLDMIREKMTADIKKLNLSKKKG